MQNTKKLIIYTRVSSKKQVREGNGLDTQEQACRAWAKRNGYVVVQVFSDEGISGATMNRPGLQDMLAFVAKSKEKLIILAYDMSRFARDVAIYDTIRCTIKKLGHTMQTANMALDDSEEGELSEDVIASVDSYARKKNKRNAIDGMRKSFNDGFWVMRAIVGHKEKRIGGKIHHVRNEPTATYIQEALEGFANCRFLRQKDVFDFLKDKPLTIYGGKPVKLTLNAVKNILTNEKYTGFFAYAKWGIPYQRWAVEPIISVETFRKIQDRLNPKKTIQTRKYNMNDEAFPLRRWVRCAVCGEKMTASKPKSKSGKRHLYYHCHHKGCDMYGKGIKQVDIHQDFEKVLESITPKEKLVLAAIRLVKESYEDLTEDVRNSAAAKQAEIASKTVDKEKAFTLLMDNANAPEIANMCKEKISALTAEIEQLTQETTVKEIKVKPLGEATDCVIDFITQPLQIWCAGDYSHKQGVLNLCFGEQISYDKTKKFGTPKLSPIFAVFSEKELESKDWRAQKDSNPQSSDP